MFQMIQFYSAKLEAFTFGRPINDRRFPCRPPERCRSPHSPPARHCHPRRREGPVGGCFWPWTSVAGCSIAHS